MKITGPRIQELVEEGVLVIHRFDPAQVNPASYDLRLGSTIKTYANEFLIHGQNNPTVTKEYTKDSMIELRPGEIYLAETMEWTETPYPYLPVLNGKSSIGRLGIKVHITAGYGDPGFKGRWTLELEVTKKVMIRPGIRICQISYETVEGPELVYSGRYQNQEGAQEYIPLQEERL